MGEMEGSMEGGKELGRLCGLNLLCFVSYATKVEGNATSRWSVRSARALHGVLDYNLDEWSPFRAPHNAVSWRLLECASTSWSTAHCGVLECFGVQGTRYRVQGSSYIPPTFLPPRVTTIEDIGEEQDRGVPKRESVVRFLLLLSYAKAERGLGARSPAGVNQPPHSAPGGVIKSRLVGW